MTNALMTVPAAKSRKPDRRAYATDDARWEAVLTKDAEADGRFYFAVQTTGVYCRPSCSARPALRRNVSFFNTLDAAERAGFRPCKRCSPTGPTRSEEH